MAALLRDPNARREPRPCLQVSPRDGASDDYNAITKIINMPSFARFIRGSNSGGIGTTLFHGEYQVDLSTTRLARDDDRLSRNPEIFLVYY